MPEVVVVGSFKINAGKEEEALEAFTALVQPTHARTAASCMRCIAAPTTLPA